MITRTRPRKSHGVRGNMGLRALLALAALAIGAGCADGSAQPPPTVTNPSGGSYDSCVPTENSIPVSDDCGVWASSSQGHDGNAGIKAGPTKTLGEAIARASEQGETGRVYACAEEFPEAVVVPPGITLYGGLDCAGEWAWIGDQKKTTIAAPPDFIAVTLFEGVAITRFEDVAVRAADGEAPGASSIAVLAHAVTAELVRCDLIAGDGAAGADGAPGVEPPMPGAPVPAAQAGLPGTSGFGACGTGGGSGGPAPLLSGGAAVQTECEAGESSIGGKGGDGSVAEGFAGEPGQTGAAGQAGLGEPASGGGWSCVMGSGLGGDGSSGEVGEPGAGAVGSGELSLTAGYVGVSGGAGTAGRPGQGGGGGGGARGSQNCVLGFAGSGGSGGSGGAGGCGGQPGQGGAAGGVSFGLVSIDATVTLVNSTIAAGSGGRGGAGGDAQPGGEGGLPGPGGVASGTVKAGCAGGKGGSGGMGGPGGGGSGGHAAAIAFRGAAVVRSGEIPLAFGIPGLGGLGGDGNAASNEGSNGQAQEELELP